MKRSNAPTLQDVAREAGVTAMTVSVVLNGARSSTRVSEVTRSRIHEAAARLRYRPNAVARGLSRRRMDTIGVTAAIDGGEINLYFLEVLNGILEAAAKHGQNTTVFSISDWQADEERLMGFCDGRVDGMILIGPLLSQSFTQAFTHHTPFITLHSDVALPHTYNLDIDDEAAAYAIVQHLISLGHRHIYHFSGGEYSSGANSRMAGYRRALAEADVMPEENWVIRGNFSLQSGRQRMTDLLRERPGAALPTAIFCANDAIAIGCLEVLASQHIRVPEEISICGFDDMLTAQMTTPPLTTIRQPFRQMGQHAVELLMPQINGNSIARVGDETPSVEDFQCELFDVEVIVRGSTGPPPAKL